MNKDADRYLSIHCWLVRRYQKTDRNGRKWLDQYRGGKPTKYKRLERAFFKRYMTRWMAAR